MSGKLSVPERHQLKVAKDTLRMHPAMAEVMGGPTAAEAWKTIVELTGQEPQMTDCHPEVWYRMGSAG